MKMIKFLALTNGLFYDATTGTLSR